MNERFQNALKRIPQNIPPVWMMRQAGRYHRHYQGLRQKYSFMELCKQPELAAEVALGPILDFDFDVAILFSDLLFPLEALGMGLEYTEQGPRLGWHLTDENSLRNLGTLLEAKPRLQFQGEAVRCTRERLPAQKSLIGFVGGPWTLFAYAVQGTHSGSLQKAKSHLSLFKNFAEVLAPLLKFAIETQLQSGAESVMIFDTAAGELSWDLFASLMAPQLKALAEIAPGRVGYYARGISEVQLEWVQSFPWAGIGFDQRFRLSQQLAKGQGGFVQGNFDPALLHLPLGDLKRVFAQYLEEFRALSPEQRAGWVFGLGHGVLPHTPEENVRYLVEMVREVFK